MLDSGVDRDVISKTVIEELDITTKEMEMRVITVDHSATSQRSLVSFIVESVDEVIVRTSTAHSLEDC